MPVRKHQICPQCNGKGNIMVDACDHEWFIENDWSMTLGKISQKCKKCGKSIIG